MTKPHSEDSLVRAESNLEAYPLFAMKARNRKEDQLVFERQIQGKMARRCCSAGRWNPQPSSVCRGLSTKTCTWQFCSYSR